MNVKIQDRRLSIGQVARQAGVGVETVRFYEREGIIEEPPRTESGYRQYSGSAVDRIRFTKQAKELGFTLKEIKELLSLRVRPGRTCADVRSLAEAKVSEVEEKLQTLRRMRKALAGLIRACRTSGSTDECPILGALDSRETHEQ